jgi:uncharacterized protein (DUF697 family)
MADKREGGALDDLLGLMDRIPFLGSVKNDLGQLRKLLYDRRAGRVLVVGAAGSGRTTLVTGLFGGDGGEIVAPPDQWVRIEHRGRHLDWLEIESGSPGASRLDAISRAIDETAPDCVVFVARADRVAAEVEGLVKAHGAIATLLEARNLKPPMFAVVAQADRLVGEGTHPPYADVAAIDAATGTLKKKLDEASVSLPRAIPCSALGPAEARWNLREVADEIWARLPETSHIEAVRALPVGQERRRELARTVVARFSTIAVTVGLAPIPFADAMILIPLQGVMVTHIAYIAGQPLDRRAAAEWLGGVGALGGAAMGLRWSAQQIVKLVPGWGTIISASFAGGGTMAMGHSAIAYFVDGPGARGVRALLPATGTPID